MNKTNKHQVYNICKKQPGKRRLQPLQPRDNIEYMYDRAKDHVKQPPAVLRFEDEVQHKTPKRTADWMPINFLKSKAERHSGETGLSFVVCDDTGEATPMIQEEFWEFLDKGSWKRQLRICDGRLLETILTFLHQLQREKMLRTFKITHFDMIRCKTSGFGQHHSILKNKWQGMTLPVKAKLTYYTAGPNYVPAATSSFATRNKKLLEGLTKHTEWLEAVQVQYGFKNSIDSYYMSRVFSEHAEQSPDTDPEIGKRAETAKTDFNLQRAVSSTQQQPTSESGDGTLRGSQRNAQRNAQRNTGRSVKTQDSVLSNEWHSVSNAIMRDYTNSKEKNLYDVRSVPSGALTGVMTEAMAKRYWSQLQSLEEDTTLEDIHARVKTGKLADSQELACPTKQQNPYAIWALKSNRVKALKPLHNLQGPTEMPRLEPMSQKKPTQAKSSPRSKKKVNFRKSKLIHSPKSAKQKTLERQEIDTRKLKANWSCEQFDKAKSADEEQRITEQAGKDDIEEVDVASEEPPPSVYQSSLSTAVQGDDNLPPTDNLPSTGRLTKLNPTPYLIRTPSILTVKHGEIPDIVDHFQTVQEHFSRDKLIKLCCEYVVRTEHVTVAKGFAGLQTVTSLVINRGADLI